jgi:hypothetical protein
MGEERVGVRIIDKVARRPEANLQNEFDAEDAVIGVIERSTQT